MPTKKPAPAPKKAAAKKVPAKKKPTQKGKPGPKPVKRDACEALGVEGLCELLIAGKSQTAIARDIGVSLATLIAWIARDSERSTRVREARRTSAGTFSDMAEAELRLAGDPFELARARELASHFRWKASKMDPGGYGDKTTLAGDPEAPLAFLMMEQIAADPRSRLAIK